MEKVEWSRVRKDSLKTTQSGEAVVVADQPIKYLPSPPQGAIIYVPDVLNCKLSAMTPLGIVGVVLSSIFGSGGVGVIVYVKRWRIYLFFLRWRGPQEEAPHPLADQGPVIQELEEGENVLAVDSIN